LESREAFVGADEVEDAGVGFRLWREKRAAGSLFGDIVAAARVDPEMADMLDTLDFLPIGGFELKGSRRFAVPTDDILFVEAAGFAVAGDG